MSELEKAPDAFVVLCPKSIPSTATSNVRNAAKPLPMTFTFCPTR